MYKLTCALDKISWGFWDMGAYLHMHGYAIKVKLTVLRYFGGPKKFTKQNMTFPICHRLNNQVKNVNIQI